MTLTINSTCNATLDEMRIGPSEEPIVGNITFHTLAILISAACALIAILLSLYLMWMHAIHYTKPDQQRHIIRILFMVPIYAAASFLSIWFYWHAIYFQVLSDCYEAFAIASFFALLCHYIAPNLHEQKEYFRGIQPKGWVWPVSTMRKCCGMDRGPWRTPRSGLTWFNIIWTGIYQYCFIRVTMTITAVVTQYLNKYCESSNSPLFAHIWILVVESIAVTIAMFAVIQFYIQLRKDLAEHSPFLKVLAIKLVIFLSFWQTFLISILTSTNFIHPGSKIAYPDIKVGIPSLLLCVEMAIFSILHQFAFPWKPYSKSAKSSKYPMSSSDSMNDIGPKQGGFLGLKAIADALNPWDLVKGFARGMRWLFVGRRHREEDPSYKGSSFGISNPGNDNDMTLQPTKMGGNSYKGNVDLPIANEFRRSNFGMPALRPGDGEEGAGLIAHAQPNPLNPSNSGYVPARQRYDSNGQDISSGGTHYDGPVDGSPDRLMDRNPTPGTVRRQDKKPQTEIGMAVSGEPQQYMGQVASQQYQSYNPQGQGRPQQQTPSEQWANSSRPTGPPLGESQPALHNALWGAKGNNDGQF